MSELEELLATEWWKSSTGDAVDSAVAVLRSLDRNDEEIANFLLPLIAAIRDEYGD